MPRVVHNSMMSTSVDASFANDSGKRNENSRGNRLAGGGQTKRTHSTHCGSKWPIWKRSCGANYPLGRGGSAAQAGTVATSGDARVEKLMATKRFYMTQNVQLLDTLKGGRANSAPATPLGSSSLEVDAFLIHFLGVDDAQEIDGISCIARTRGVGQDKAICMPLVDDVIDHKKQQLQRYLILQRESLANGTCSLKTGSPEETKATIEGMVHSQ
ncbi:hypothetical protein H257_06509 [Aphanomyces astaci]|uniref:Uncharacterized protein n=1 Tax=Aphanomyces astaci TaxID=112090 RepID=W4GKE5_APHAT|nr:hypothetical protein H257_06509 [Aphanomyces astaci]ETV80127.1 hypothetical protein H257_06509 [Aphanomyces astaci]|eukprot:XP_009830051.1 hypothetical protein H257_06509 [Aphanomyces astaci]